MKKTIRTNHWGGHWIAVFMAIIGFTFTACPDDTGQPGDEDAAVTLSGVTANGSSSLTTTHLTLTFDKAISELSADDITLSGVSGVSKGTLGGTGPAYTLPISGFTSGGTLSVAVAKSGYTISGSPKTVTVFYYNDYYPNLGKDIMTLPSMWKQFEDKFLIGNIFSPGDATAATGINTPSLKLHFNVLTPENAMKPSEIAKTRNSSTGVITYSWDTADRMVNAAIASNIKIVGHTLLWHQQNAAWMNNMATADSTTALNAMKTYITDVVSHFQGKIYSWDVLNEVFPDNASDDWKGAMRKTGSEPNPWYVAIGSDFVYEGFLAARQADSNAILYYNDYNLDLTGKATMVRDMVRDVNQRYAAAFPSANRKLIEGIGMQSHHNTTVTASAIRNTLNLFRPLGVKISISELDVLGQSYGAFSSVGGGSNKHGSSTVNAQGLADQAKLYGEYMALFVENADIIERVSLWGVTDNQSWRSAGLPLLFDPNGKAKAAYDSFVALGAEVENPAELPIVDDNPVLTAINKDGTGVSINGNKVTINTTSATGHGFSYSFPDEVDSSFRLITVNFKITSYTTGTAKFVAKKNTDFSTDINEDNGSRYFDVGSSVGAVKSMTYNLSDCVGNIIVFQHNSYGKASNDNINVNYTVEVTFRFTK